jgi:hypothetical protein
MRFMLLQSYGATDTSIQPMSSWASQDIRAHIDYQLALNAELIERGELIDAQGLAAPGLAKFVTYSGEDTPLVTDGPLAESKELLAGYRIVDVDSPERAIEIANEISAAPGPGGRPVAQRIEMREVMTAPPSTDA